MHRDTANNCDICRHPTYSFVAISSIIAWYSVFFPSISCFLFYFRQSLSRSAFVNLRTTPPLRHNFFVKGTRSRTIQ